MPPAAPRDRYVDLLRAASILLVVVGHWLILAAEHMGPLVPWKAWITWGFQVIPIFFLVGGALNEASWRRAQRRDEPWSAWIRKRAQRLLVPLGPLLVFWILVVPILLLSGVPSSFVHQAAHAAFVPTWFLGVYLGIVAITPITWRLHRRFGWGVPVAFLVGALAVDALGRVGAPLVWVLNGVFVWGAIHQVGYFWREDRLPRRPIEGLAIAVAGLACLFGFVLLARYPVSMVAIGESGNNVSPPTAALLALAAAQLGLAIVLRPALSALLERPRAWRGVAIAGSMLLTIYLWHMTAILLTAALAWAVGAWPEAPDISASSWIARPAWIAVILAAMAALVLAFRRYERIPTRPEARPSAARAVAGLAATLLGVLWLQGHGVYPPETDLAVVQSGLATLVLGLALLGALRLKPYQA